DNHIEWLRTSMSAGAGGRRFPNDIEFGENFKNFAQYGRGYTRYVLLRLEDAFGHKERVDLDNATIEHLMPQTMTNEWKMEVGAHADSVHARLKDTFGNLSLTGYNTELGNLPFREKKAKLANTHIELNRFVLEQTRWGEGEIVKRAETMFKTAIKLWPGPITQAAPPAVTPDMTAARPADA
ncbi:MAG TPA: HNH endonuclease family protein, partial [Rhodopila sp.]